MTTATKTDLEDVVRQEDEQHHADELAQRRDRADGTESGEDPDTGKIFDVPRVKVAVDDTDPTVLKVAFAGGIEIERGDKRDVEFYNRLKAGKSVDLQVTVHVAGAKVTHRRDSEGDVDAVVQTKSLIVTNVEVGE